jgi:4-hydroxy-tetrahydrodipicolinate synthase
MPSSSELRGVYLPLVTPFSPSGDVDLGALERIAHHFLDAGLAGLVALGTTGEPATLTASERRSVVDVCSRVCVQRNAQLIVGPGSNNTAGTIADVGQLADVAGVTAALVVVPYYTRPGQAGIVAHFTAVADASPVPVVLYNIPYRTGEALEPDGLLRLASHPNIIGVKQSVGLDHAALRILAESPPDFAVLCGEDPYLFPSAVLGGAGAIAASAHLCTERIVAMVDAGLNGRVEEGRAHHEALLSVIAAAFAEPSPTVIKGILHRGGLIASAGVRLPLVAASTAAVDRAMAAFAAVER